MITVVRFAVDKSANTKQIRLLHALCLRWASPPSQVDDQCVTLCSTADREKETTMQLQMAGLELLKPMSNPGRDIQGEASGKLQHA